MKIKSGQFVQRQILESLKKFNPELYYPRIMGMPATR